MADDLTIQIGGDASGATSAAGQTQSSLTGLGSTIQQVSAQAASALAQLSSAAQQAVTALQQMQSGQTQNASATQQATAAQQQQLSTAQAGTSAIQQQTTAMQQQLAVINYVASATKTLDAATVQMNADWLNGVAGTTQFTSVLQYLQAQLQLTAASMGGPGSGFSGATGDAVSQIADFTGNILAALNPLDLLHSNILRLVETMGMWRLMEQGVHAFTDALKEVASLPVTMQSTELAWEYTYGMGQTVNPTGNMQTAQNISQQLAAWSARDSYNLPFTRQDMMQSITNLSMANLTPAGVEQYLPVLADLAATAGNGFGGGPVTLSRASYAVQGALMGYNRMLQYDLHIRPEQLTQYGYDANNPATLLPALMQYAEKTHRTQWQMVNPQTNQPYGQNVDISQMDPNELAYLIQSGQIQDTGAAKNIAHTTWSGAWSSFQDRLQNFALDIGGYPAFGSGAGQLRKNSPLDMAMQGLNAFTQWWDDHQPQFNQMADFFSKTLGQAMSDAGSGLESFARGLARSGIGDFLAHGMGDLSHLLSNPQFQQTIKVVAGGAGQVAGTTLEGLLTGLSNAVGGLKDMLSKFENALGPSGQQGLSNGLRYLPGAVASMGGSALGDFLSMLGDLGGGSLKTWRDFLQHPMSGKWLGDEFGTLGQVGNDFASSNVDWFDQFMNLAGNPGGYKHGAATNWWKHTASPWLGGVGGGINHWLGQAAGAVGGFFGGIPGAVGSAAGAVGNWLGGVGQGIGNAAGAVGAWAGGVGQSIGNAAGAVAGAPQRFADWMYQHNYYWQGMVDNGTKALHSMESTLGSWGQAISTDVGQAWSTVSSTVSHWTQQVVSTVGGWGQQVATVAKKGWTTVETDAGAVWSSITSALDTWTKPLRDKITQLTGWISTQWTTLVSTAEQWGSNLVKMIAQGVGDGVTWVEKQGGNVASAIEKILGFHSPAKEGPGADADQWMPNLVKMLASGLSAGVPTVEAASSQLGAAIYAGLFGTSHAGTSVAAAGPLQGLTTLFGGDFAKALTTTRDLLGYVTNAFIDLNTALKSLLDTLGRSPLGGGGGQSSYAAMLRGPGGYRVPGGVGQ